MEKIRNLSLRKSIILYMLVCLAACFFLGVGVMAAAQKIQKNIWNKYIDQDSYLDTVPRIYGQDMEETDRIIVEACDFLETWGILLVSMLGCTAGVFLFYRNKIRTPVETLAEGARRIEKNDLDFTISYENRDELGVLCTQFEKMRRQLRENNSRMWKMVEDEKSLRAAIAHDIRSPLAVLNGYQEMLLEFVPEDKLDKAQVLEILQAELGQIQRISQFVETMRRLSALEDRQVNYQLISLRDLDAQIAQAARVMEQDTGKTCVVDTKEKDAQVEADSLLVLEVAENLISNACRYACEKVEVQLRKRGSVLEIQVRDDGSGFQENQETVTKAYYHDGPGDDPSHFGLGLYLCKVYCEKHGGGLHVGNSKEGGALVKAFFLEPDKAGSEA